ncbi:MAG: response regulator [Chitinivibrionales bacterium]|nr:response regulator [Chitinivibrionales bacterium]
MDAKKKIIVHVDDDADIRTTVQTVLRNEGYEVRSFDTMEYFSKNLENERPDLIVLDIMVEKEDSGLIAYDEISKKYPGIPLVILTTLGEMILPYFEDKKERICILEKPVLPERLVAVVRSRLEASASGNG